MRNLIFITSTFPYGNGETFIENEYAYLSEAFDRIIIITNTPPEKSCRKTSDNTVAIEFFPYQLSLIEKLFAVFSFFNKTIIKEKKIIKNNYKLTLTNKRLATLLSSYYKGKKLLNYVEHIIKKHDFNPEETWLYSYWLNDMASGVACIKRKNISFKTLARAHRWDVYPEQSTIDYLPLRNFICEYLDAVFPISINAKDKLISMVDDKFHHKIKYIPLGTFNNNKSNVPSSSGKSLHIVSCSGFIKRKRIDKIIDAIGLIENIDIHWTHIGTGELKEVLSNKAKEILGNKNNIHYELMGEIANKEIPMFYTSNPVDVFINTSADEGIPVSIMEALSFGIPIIATKVGGVNEIIDDRINGFLLPPNPEPAMIAEKITEYYFLPDYKKKEIQQYAKEKWEKNFNAEKNYKEFIVDVLSLNVC